MNDILYLIGLIAVFISPCAVGFIAARRTEREEKETKSFLSLVVHIKNEIGSYMTRQEEIFVNFRDPYLENSGFLGLLRKSRITEESALKKALVCYSDRKSVSDDVYSHLISLGDVLGKTSAPRQEEACDMCITALEEAYGKIKEKSAEKAKAYRVLGFAAGGACVILFL